MLQWQKNSLLIVANGLCMVVLVFYGFKDLNMTQIEKYIERLKNLQNLYKEGQPQHNAFGIAIVEAKEMLVKNSSIPDISNCDHKDEYGNDLLKYVAEIGLNYCSKCDSCS